MNTSDALDTLQTILENYAEAERCMCPECFREGGAAENPKNCPTNNLLIRGQEALDLLRKEV